MKLTTQDGRLLELSHEYRLFTWSGHSDGEPRVTITLEGEPHKVDSKIRYYSDGKWHEQPNFYWHREEKLRDTVGFYATNVRAQRASRMLDEAWENGATEFEMPQDTAEILTADEQFEEFCEENHLTLVSINELGYKPSDIPHNLHIWRTTSEFERHGILVADKNADINSFGGVYSTSLKKWQALQMGVA